MQASALLGVYSHTCFVNTFDALWIYVRVRVARHPDGRRGERAALVPAAWAETQGNVMNSSRCRREARLLETQGTGTNASRCRREAR